MRDERVEDNSFYQCYSCNHQSDDDRRESLLLHSGLNEFKNTIEKLTGGCISVPNDLHANNSDPDFVLTLPRTKNGVWPWVGKKAAATSDLRFVFRVLVFDPFVSSSFRDQFENVLRWKSRVDHATVVVAIGPRESIVPSIQDASRQGVAVVMLPDYRLFEPVNATVIPWLREISQLPREHEIEQVRESLMKAESLDKDMSAEAMANETGLQPSLVEECVRLLRTKATQSSRDLVKTRKEEIL